MPEEYNVTYRYLDSEADRKRLVEDIRRVRRTVLQMVETVPRDKWYEPRYHDWSLAAMLGHLQAIDNLSLIQLKLALLGIRFPIPMEILNRFNNLTARIFRNRVVETTIHGIQKNEKRIADFIMYLPMDKFTAQVYHPPTNKYLTAEQAVQMLFLYHWQLHLQTMREVEGIYYEPPQSRDASI
jgi:hypothetical protein